MEQNQYAIVDVIEFHADIKETTSPFRYPNQIAWYEKSDDIISFALDTVKDADNDLKRIHDIYNKVAQTITYDDAKAKQASNKYMLSLIHIYTFTITARSDFYYLHKRSSCCLLYTSRCV